MSLVTELNETKNGDHESQPDEEMNKPPATGNNKCEICKEINHKYTCPRCCMKTCSLQCCRKHKEQFSCSGERDRTKFVSKGQFDESLLLSDYKFLEENNLLVDTFQRSNLEKTEQKQQNFGSHENLRKFLHKNFNINLKLMPVESSRHLNNKTRFNKTSNLVSWTLEFLFYSPASVDKRASFVKFDTKAFLFSCKDTLREILRKFLKKFKLELVNNEKNRAVCSLYGLESTTNNDNGNELAIADWNALYEVVDLGSKRKYFLKFDTGHTLEECLRNKTVIEFPSIYLIKNEHLNLFDIKFDSMHVQESVTSINRQSHVFVQPKIPSTDSISQAAEHVFKAPRPVTTASLEDGEVEDGEVNDDDDNEDSGHEEYQGETKKVKISN